MSLLFTVQCIVLLVFDKMLVTVTTTVVDSTQGWTTMLWMTSLSSQDNYSLTNDSYKQQFVVFNQNR